MKFLSKFVVFATLVGIIAASVHDWDEPVTIEPTNELTYLIYNVTFNETRDHNLFFQIDIRHMFEYYTKTRIVVGDDTDKELMSSATIMADSLNNVLEMAVFVPNASNFYCFFNIFGKVIPSPNLQTCNGQYGMSLKHVMTKPNGTSSPPPPPATNDEIPSPILKGLTSDEYEFVSSETYPVTYTSWDFKNCKDVGLIISVSQGVNVDSVLQMDINDYLRNVTKTEK